MKHLDMRWALACMIAALATPIYAANPAPVTVTNTPLPVTVQGQTTPVPVTVRNPTASPVPVQVINDPTTGGSNVSVTNSTTNPVPVIVVPSAGQPTVTCKLNFPANIGSGPVAQFGLYASTNQLRCSQPVTAINVLRVVLDLSNSQNAASYFATISTGSFGPQGIDPGDPIAMLSADNSERALASPVRFNLSATDAVGANGICTSGIAGIVPTCLAVLYLIGTPAQ